MIKLITSPIIIPMAETNLIPEGVGAMIDYLRERNPECVEGGGDLFPHSLLDDERELSGAELLTEFSGRSCYYSFGKKAGKKTNKEYLKHVGEIKHLSIFYHVKNVYFFSGISRRMAKELQRHYIGHSKDEEGSPSQESTRFTHHPGRYVVHPRDVNNPIELEKFRQLCEENYKSYCEYIQRQELEFIEQNGKKPFGLDRKRIYECAAGRLLEQAETSFVWSTNPVAEVKLWQERMHESADLEFQRFAKAWKEVAVKRHPNIYESLCS